jgi:steroid 5-alpha reductase family enzyme
MFDLAIYGDGLAVAMVIAIAGWLVSIPRRDVSIVDSLWSLLFLAMLVTYLLLAPTPADRGYLVLFVVTVWAVRLSVFVTMRNWGEAEDRRYAKLRAANDPGFTFKSLYIVFGVQAVLAWVISLPLHAAVLGTAPLGWIDYAAVMLWLAGFAFESIGDQQLASFKADPANQGKVLDRGLWRYTRHPNYFGEACIWWAFYLFALAAGAWWSIIGPLLMTYLLLRVSGVTLLESDITERRPAYRDYIARTNAFLPAPRKVGGSVP